MADHGGGQMDFVSHMFRLANEQSNSGHNSAHAAIQQGSQVCSQIDNSVFGGESVNENFKSLIVSALSGSVTGNHQLGGGDVATTVGGFVKGVSGTELQMTDFSKADIEAQKLSGFQQGADVSVSGGGLGKG